MDRDNFMTALEAKQFGLIDVVIQTNKPVEKDQLKKEEEQVAETES